MIRVTIVSPNHALRVGLREMLGRQPDIQVVGETSELDDVHESEIGVVIFAPVSAARSAGTRSSFSILLITDDVEDARRLMSSDSRAWGVLSADATEEELAAAVRAVGEGLWVVAPSLARSLIRLNGRREFAGEESLVEPLTAREMEVLQLMAQGLANKQIALKLGISEHTVKFHLSSLYAKLNSTSRTEAVKRGLELGLISL